MKKLNKSEYLNKPQDIDLLYGIEVPTELIDAYAEYELNEKNIIKQKRRERIRNKKVLRRAE